MHSTLEHGGTARTERHYGCHQARLPGNGDPAPLGSMALPLAYLSARASP